MLKFYIAAKHKEQKNLQLDEVHHNVLPAASPLLLETASTPSALSTFKFSYGGKGLQKNQFTNRATSSVWPFISDTPPLSPVLTVHDIPLICLMKI